MFEPLLLVDTNAAARETQLRNHPETRYLLADLGELSAKDLYDAAGIGKSQSLDVLIGGPPCQGFSKLNKLVRQALDDPRNVMFGRFLEIVRDMQPRFVLIENVPNLLDFDGGRYRDEAFLRLTEAGYFPPLACSRRTSLDCRN